LRAHRARKSPLGNQVDEVFPEATRAASEFLNYFPEHPTRRELSIRSDRRSTPFQDAHEEEDNEMLVEVGEHEVGIT
jgi:hypothetical protein